MIVQQKAALDRAATAILTERIFWLMIAERTCRTCAWHDSFSWACFNGDSPYRADFTQNEQKCRFWELQKPQNAEIAEIAESVESAESQSDG